MKHTRDTKHTKDTKRTKRTKHTKHAEAIHRSPFAVRRFLSIVAATLALALCALFPVSASACDTCGYAIGGHNPEKVKIEPCQDIDVTVRANVTCSPQDMWPVSTTIKLARKEADKYRSPDTGTIKTNVVLSSHCGCGNAISKIANVEIMFADEVDGDNGMANGEVKQSMRVWIGLGKTAANNGAGSLSLYRSMTPGFDIHMPARSVCLARTWRMR
jgi:hypothetical protein